MDCVSEEIQLRENARKTRVVEETIRNKTGINYEK